jgi:hypothetical protein
MNHIVRLLLNIFGEPAAEGLVRENPFRRC